MSKISFDKLSLTLPQQLVLLEEKGLIITNLEFAERWLSHVSYFRFKHYSYSFKDYKGENGNYIPGTTFETIKDLYSFDQKIKMLLFEALENIEIAVKTQLTNTFSSVYGPHWYTDEKHFFSEKERRQIIRNAEKGEGIPKLFDHSASSFVDDGRNYNLWHSFYII